MADKKDETAGMGAFEKFLWCADREERRKERHLRKLMESEEMGRLGRVQDQTLCANCRSSLCPGCKSG